MDYKTKLGLMLGKFPNLARFVGLTPHINHKVPHAPDKLRQKFQEYSQAAVSADQTWHKLVKQYCGDKKEYTYTELDKAYSEHPDFVDACNLRQETAMQLEYICRKHPELWRPGHDIEWFYNTDIIKKQMLEIFNSESEYLAELTARAHELLEQTRHLPPDSEEVIKALNEMYFIEDLLEDATKTIGDKFSKIWWNAIPDVLKHIYAKTMDNAIVRALAENDKLTDYVLNFETMSQNLNANQKFLKLLQQELTKHVFGLEQSVKCVIATKKDFDVNGLYYADENKVVISTKRFNTNIDTLIGTIKHEFLGHHIDEVAANYGLQGESMSKFIKKEFGTLDSHGDKEKFFYVLRSPLLNTHYDIDDMTEDELKPLYAQGWKRIREMDIFEYETYRNKFDERAAWLLTDTYGILDKVIEYRRTHGLPVIEKVK